MFLLRRGPSRLLETTAKDARESKTAEKETIAVEHSVGLQRAGCISIKSQSSTDERKKKRMDESGHSREQT